MYIDPVAEYNTISFWMSDIIGKKITPKNFVQRLGKHLSRNHATRVKLYVGKDEHLDRGDFSIGAEYDPDLDEKKKKQLIINFIVNYPKRGLWLITPELADRFVIDMVETLVHEYQHQHQYRSRRFKINRGFVSKSTDPALKEDQEYLGQPDEIDAYSANIAARFWILNHKLKENADSLDLLQYYKVFGKTHPVTRKLLKKIFVNIQLLTDIDNGKAKPIRKGKPRPKSATNPWYSW